MTENHDSTHWVVLSDGARPTEDIYFLESAAPALRESGISVYRLDTQRRPLSLWQSNKKVQQRLLGSKVILCRSVSLGWLQWLERHRDELAGVYYLIDDDLAAAAVDSSLPPSYRSRMHRMADMQPRLLAVADEVIVSSSILLEYFSTQHQRVSLLTPPLLAPLPPLWHFSRPPLVKAPWWIGYHGSRAHQRDLRMIVPALMELYQERPDVCYEVMLGQHTPGPLRNLERCETPRPLSWHRFRSYQRQRRMHIGLAPLMDTPFNQCKSWIKFLDIASMGAVGIYSCRYPYDEIVEDGVNGLLAGDTAEDWLRCLRVLIENPEQTLEMAQHAADTAREIGDIARAEAFWRERS